MGWGPWRGFSGGGGRAGNFYFLICAVVTRALALVALLSYTFVRMVFYFTSQWKVKKKKPSHKSDHITDLIKPFNGLIMLVRKSSSSFTWWTRPCSIWVSIQASKFANFLPTFNFQFLKSTLLSYVTVSEHQSVLLGTIKHALFPRHWFLSICPSGPSRKAFPDAPALGEVFPSHPILSLS